RHRAAAFDSHPAAHRACVGYAAALPDHNRGRAQAAAAPQGLDRISAARPNPLTASEWLDVFTRIGAGVRRAVLPLSGTEAGRAQLSVGAGGDTTMELDRAAEDVVFAELTNVAEGGQTFSVLSEEVGRRSF